MSYTPITDWGSKPRNNRPMAEVMIGVIKQDMDNYCCQHGENPKKIFLSRQLRDLLLAYDREHVVNYSTGPILRMFGIPVSWYIPHDPDAFEYYFANHGCNLDIFKE